MTETTIIEKMKQFYPEIDNYTILCNPTETDFVNSKHNIILPKERKENFVFITNTAIIKPNHNVWKNLFNLHE